MISISFFPAGAPRTNDVWVFLKLQLKLLLFNDSLSMSLLSDIIHFCYDIFYLTENDNDVWIKKLNSRKPCATTDSGKTS